VRLILPAKHLAWDEEKCTHCGVCTGQCLPNALEADQKTGLLSFNHDRCLACELCIPACPFGALESVSEVIEGH